jgi:hypothetical protein
MLLTDPGLPSTHQQPECKTEIHDSMAGKLRQQDIASVYNKIAKDADKDVMRPELGARVRFVDSPRLNMKYTIHQVIRGKTCAAG